MIQRLHEPLHAGFGLAVGGPASARPASGRLTPTHHLQRAAVAAFLAAAGRGTPQFPGDVVRERWPDDVVTPQVLHHAAITPSTTDNAAWAGALAAAAPGEFFASLGSQSAASRLINAGVRIALDGVAGATFPRVLAPPVAPWIAEAAPIPVVSMTVDAAVIGPAKKLAVIVALTGEIAAHSAAEAVVTAILREAAAASLDAAVFSNAPADASRPAGLLNGIAPTRAKTGGGEAAMLADLAALVAEVTSAGGAPESLAIIAAPPQAGQILLRLPDLRIPTWSSRAMPNGQVAVVDTAAFASGFGPDVEIRASRDAAAHMEDATPLPLATGAQGQSVLAVPTRSYLPTDTIGLRMVAKAAFVMRAPLVAYVDAATW